MRPALDAYQHLGGWCSDIEAAALQEAAKDKTVLEIGVWKGRSTVAMAATAKHILSIDHFHGDDFAGYGCPVHETIDTLLPSREITALVVGDWKVIRNYLSPFQFQFIYYDACHLYESTKDFLDWVDKFNTSFGLHDVDNNPNHEGVKRALHEYTEDYTLHDRLAIVRKPG